MIRGQERKYRHLLHCVLLSAFTATAIFIYYILFNKGYFTITADFDRQQIPFTIDLHNQIKYGLDGWVWNYDLGQSMIKAFSFSALGSPFFWLSMLAPATAFPYVAGWLYCLKYVAAAVASYFFFTRFVENDRYAVVGAMLYAFSGFQATNLIFYSFHDVVALFPLLLIGLERAVGEEGDNLFFIFAVFLNCLLNYFFFVQEVLFLAIYFLFRFSCRDGRVMVRRILRCAVCGIVGVCMAAVLFLPNVIYMLSSPRMDVSVEGTKIFYDLKELLFVLKGILLPAESLQDQSCLVKENYLSVCCYLPMLGTIPAVAYLRRRRDRLSGLILCCLVISMFPILSAGFTLFTELYYRWWYMFTAVMALAACIVLERAQERDILFGAAVHIALVAVFFVLVNLVSPEAGEESAVYHMKRLIAFCAFSVSGAGLTWLVFRFGKRKELLLWLGIAAFAVVMHVNVMYTYKLYNHDDGSELKSSIELGSSLEVIDPQYRYDIVFNALSLTGDASSMKIFSSTRNEGSVEFDGLFGYFNGFSSMDKNSIEGLCELMGAKYYISSETDGSHVREYRRDGAVSYVLEKPACPIGFAMESYILREDFDAITVSRRGVVLLQAAVINAEDEAKVSGMANRVGTFDVSLGEEPEALAAINSRAAVSGFERDHKGFRCVSDYEKDTLIYFSVPYDKGWRATVDGAAAEIIDSGGMMLLPVPAGEHHIAFHYSTPGYKLGLGVSLAAWTLYAAYAIVIRKKKTRSQHE